MAKGPRPPSGRWPLALCVPPGLFSNGPCCLPQPYRAHHRPESAKFGAKIGWSNWACRCNVCGGGWVMLQARREFAELPGEDLTTSALPEVAGWISIYEEMAAVLSSVILRANGSLNAEDLRGNLAWIEDRLAMLP